MRLDKVTRHRLFAGETVQLPLADHPLRRDGVYVIETEKGTRQGQFRVLVIRKGVAFIRYEGDPVRLLAQSGGDYEGCGYTDFAGRAMPSDPGEAVDELTQRRFSQAAKDREREAIGELLSAAEEFRSALSARMESPEFAARAGRDAWLVRSKLDRMLRNLRRKVA